MAAEIQTKHETECRIIVRLVGIILNNVKSTKFKDLLGFMGLGRIKKRFSLSNPLPPPRVNVINFDYIHNFFHRIRNIKLVELTISFAFLI